MHRTKPIRTRPIADDVRRERYSLALRASVLAALLEKPRRSKEVPAASKRS